MSAIGVDLGGQSGHAPPIIELERAKVSFCPPPKKNPGENFWKYWNYFRNKDKELNCYQKYHNDDSYFNYLHPISKQKRKERVGPLKRDVGNEEVIVDDEEAAEVLNKYFSSVFTLEDLGNIPEPKQTCLDSGNGLTQIIFTKNNVVEQLKRLKTDKSLGIDELHQWRFYIGNRGLSPQIMKREGFSPPHSKGGTYIFKMTLWG